MKPFEIISIESPAFEVLVQRLIEFIKSERFKETHDWINEQDALQLLGIKKSTLAAYRAQGKIKYSQIGRKVIRYSRASIEDLIRTNVKSTF